MEFYFERPLFVIRLIQVLLSLVLMLQTIEHIQLLPDMTVGKKYDWQNFRGDFLAMPRWLVRTFDFLYQDSAFKIVLALRFLVCALALLPGVIGLLPLLAGAQLILSLIIMWRWRGAFNGGSDFMALVLLMAILVSMLFFGNGFVAKAAIWYITVQVCLSYVMAGAVKLLRADWLSGEALRGFLRTSIYANPLGFNASASPLMVFQIATWGFLFFEILFPLSLLKPTWTLGFLGLGVLFHFANFLIFGLNRFFWVWIVSYPALYCSSLLLQRH